jgi:Kef-type K+ transport system membrane component KefB
MGHSSRYALSEPLTGKLCAYFVLPTVLIIAFTQLLSLILGRIRQPRVIAEVIGGVFLGPTVLGRIPGLLFSR